MAKVIHVHLKGKRIDRYFSSISAVYDVFTNEEIGVKKAVYFTLGYQEMVL